MKLLLPILFAGVAVLATASRAAADTYNFTTGGNGYVVGGQNGGPTYAVGSPYGIPGIAGTSGDFNQINDYSSPNPTSFSNEVDSSGSSAAGVGITLTNFYQTDEAYQSYTDSNGDYDFDSGLYGHFDYDWAPGSGAQYTPASATISLTNLNHSAEYEVVLYGYNSNGAGDGGRNFEVEGSGTSTEFLLEDNPANGFASDFDSVTSLAKGVQAYSGNYIVLDAYTNSSGTLTLTFDSLPTGYQTNDISGLQVESIPEPSTWAMMLAGLVALGWTARRRLAS